MASSEQKAASALADAASKLTDTTTPSYEGEERKLYDFLNSVQGKTPVDLSQYRGYIRTVAEKGQIPIAWELMKRLMVVEFTNIMHMYTVTKGQTIPVIESEPYESRYKRIQEIILSWDRPPFTTQRLCELLLQPTRQYRQGTKFLMAVTKSVYGVSTRADSEMLIKTEDDEDDMLYFDEDGVAVQIVDYFDDALFNGTNSSQGSTTGMINVSGSLPPGTPRPVPKDSIELLLGHK